MAVGDDCGERDGSRAVFSFSMWVSWGAVVAALLAFGPVLSISGCGDAAADQPSAPLAARAGGAQVEILPRCGLIDTYPCSQCHDKIEPSALQTRSRKTKHRIESQHFPGADDCLLCHHAERMDRLSTLVGQRVSFDEVYLLCGQCHGEKLRDFYSGAHGKSVGSWQGLRQRYNCTTCHNPHAPAIAPMQALPPPVIGHAARSFAMEAHP